MNIVTLYKLNKDELCKMACIRNISDYFTMNELELIESLYNKENTSKLVLNWHYDYSSLGYSSKESVNDNFIDDGDKEIYESFRDFSKLNANITERVNYIYVCSGYAHRVLEVEDIFLEFKKQKEAISILPDLYSKGINGNYEPYTIDQNGLDLCLNLPMHYIKKGGILYKLSDKSNGTELSYVDLVGKLNFCEFCQGTEATANWYEIEEEILLVFDVNTESG